MKIKISNRFPGTQKSRSQLLKAENLQELIHYKECYPKIHYLKKRSFIIPGCLLKLDVKTWEWRWSSWTRQMQQVLGLSGFTNIPKALTHFCGLFLSDLTTVLADRSAFCRTVESVYIKNLDLGLTAIRRDCSKLKDSRQSSQDTNSFLQDTLNCFSAAQR